MHGAKERWGEGKKKKKRVKEEKKFPPEPSTLNSTVKPAYNGDVLLE